MSSPAKPPAGLGKVGKQLWRDVVADVAEGWQLDALDLARLEAACHAADRVDALEAAVDEDGLMIRGSTGQNVLHPAVSEARQQRALATALLGKVELTPGEKTGHLSARQRNQRRDQLAEARKARWPRGASGG